MNKLYIEDRNNGRVPVAELELISGKEQAVIGNAQRDLVLRTAGNVSIQVGNKFYNLLSEGDQGVISSSAVIILSDISDLQSISTPEDGMFVYLSVPNSLYIVVGGQYKLITTTTNNPTQKVYLSYSESQTLTGDDKYRVLLNLGGIVTTFSELLAFNTAEIYPNQWIYVIDEQKHYIYNGNNPADSTSWIELYLSKKGGVVNGSLAVEQILSVNQDYLNNYFDASTFKGIYLGATLAKGLAIWNNQNVNFATIDGSSEFKFLTNSLDQFNTYNPLSIGGNSVGIGGAINYGYRLTVSGNTLLNSVDISDTVSSTNYIAGINGIGYSLYGSGEKTLEIDNLIVRKSLNVTNSAQYESKGVNGSYISGNDVVITSVELVDEYLHYLDATKVGLALSDSTPLSLYDKYKYYYGHDENGNFGLQQSVLFGDRDSSGTLAPYTLYNIDPDNGDLVTPTGQYTLDTGTNQFVEDPSGDLVLYTISTYKIKLTRSDISINDLLIYKRWSTEGDVINDNYLLVYDIIGTDIYVYALSEPKLNDKFVHVSKTLIQYDINSIDLVDNISNFGDIIYTAYYEDVEVPSGQLVPYTTEFWDEDIRTKIGNLKSSYNLDLDIPNDTVGLYSDNAYLKGNFIGDKLLLGNQLTYISGVLTIADLETIKSRTITGANGLNGGGNLFTSNIVISHNAKNWVDKTNLTGGDVIANLIIDSYGHPTDWVTRTLTTSEISEGSNLYYTNARVQAFGDTRYAFISGTNATGTWPISVTGNAGSATNWGGIAADFGTFGDGTIGYLTGYNTGGTANGLIKPFTKMQVQTWLDINNGTTLNNNITGNAGTWGGSTADFSSYGTNPAYLMGYDTTAGTMKPFQLPVVKTWLGLPSGAINLQYVTDNASTTTHVITAPNIQARMFSATASGDGSTYEFIIPHGLPYDPTMATVTANSIGANGRVAIIFDSSNVYITYLTNTFSPEPPPAGTNNLTWTITVK